MPDYSVSETVSAASDIAAASAKAVSATITATADTVAAVTSEAVETASSIEPTKPTITQGIKSMMKSTEDFVAFGQANLEAFVKSGQIWSAGVQELTKQIATTAKASFDESISTFKAMSTAKSVKEAMDLQSSFAKAALEKAMAESNKLTDASIKLTEQTLAPITARVTVAVETFGKSA
jgi:phasin family protein